jgi:hypothetical protein
MSDVKAHEEVHGISTALEDPARVVAGYGETTKRQGAKTKEVHNVSLHFPAFPLDYTDPDKLGGSVCCY